MRTKLKLGTENLGSTEKLGTGELLVTNNELTLTEYVGRLFRNKTRSVRELSDVEFLSLFDVPSVNDLANNGYNLRSMAALVMHFRERVESDWLAAPAYLADVGINTDHCSEKELLLRADQVLNYDLEWSGVPPELSSSGEIDWQKNILDNQQWLSRLNRHGWWPLLGLAYQRTGDERYAMAFARQMSTWVAGLDYCGSNESTIWSCRQVALRLRVSWIPAFGMFFNSPYFNTARKFEMLRAICDQARFLKQQKTNDNLVFNGGLVCAGISFPELRESKAWRKTAIDRCWSSLRTSARQNTDAANVDYKQSCNLLAFSDREIATAS